ncbi:hypothetical protein CYMTET_43214 [Cymbomonas tetramitiformis]|uniref:SEC7 domain-containing protein n=1 Tax=Cymbomonas tetramitiformis TaxID=36881 RepID=A0AAE0F0V3_9CHLO|nr:hypothetical protein CYMTET_43214 [Cymbomonas tetramitiformis]
MMDFQEVERAAALVRSAYSDRDNSQISRSESVPSINTSVCTSLSSVKDGRIKYQDYFNHAQECPVLKSLLSLDKTISSFNKKPCQRAALQLFSALSAAQDSLDDDTGSATEVEHDEPSPQAIAYQFFRASCFGKAISKVALGEYFGLPEAEDVLTEFLALISFRDMQMDTAIRKLVTYAGLPGESQKLDQIMSAFSVAYHRDNNVLWPNVSVVNYIAFALVMMNINVHSADVDNKMSCSDFKAVVYDECYCSGGYEVDMTIIEGLYSRVIEKKMFFSSAVSTSAVLPEVSQNVRLSGVLSVYLFNCLKMSLRQSRTSHTAQ